MACSDLKDAYKMIPVTLEQRRLQAYSFCGALFIELKLISGDKLAYQYFDKFHYAILLAFVYPASQFPPVAQGRTVDDIPSVVPFNAKDPLITFMKEYRNSLEALNIKAADDDPLCTKAFDCSQKSEVLSIWFNTNDFTWFPPTWQAHHTGHRPEENGQWQRHPLLLEGVRKGLEETLLWPH